MGAKFKGMATAVALRRNQTLRGKFLVSVSCASGKRRENSDDEDDKEDLVVTAGDLAQACDTHVPATEEDTKKASGQCTAASSWMPWNVRRRIGERVLLNLVRCRTHAKA